MTRWMRSVPAAFFATVVSALALPLAGCSDGGVGESVVPNVEAIVFVSRAFENADGSHNVAGGNNQTIDYLRYTPGGHLYVLSPPTPDGVLTDLTERFEGVDALRRGHGSYRPEYV